MLYDADEYFPDILESLRSATDTTLFLAGWYISPRIRIRQGLTLEQLVVSVLRQENCSCFILWNSNTVGPAPRLFDDVESFWKRVASTLGGEEVAKQRLKIIISVNLNFDLGVRLTVANQGSRLIPWGTPKSDIPPSVLDHAQEFWEKQFAGRPASKVRNLRQFTLGSHHQKTLVIAAKQQGKRVLTGYCGMDLTPSLASGGVVWHDGCLRLRSDMALGLLENFVERWNFEVDQLTDVVSFGVSASDTLASSSYFAQENHPQADDVATYRTMPVRVEYFRPPAWIVLQMGYREFRTEILDTYENLVAGVKKWLYIENQYFRHPPLAAKIAQHIEDTPDLYVTIVLPSYSEEIGLRGDLPALRDEYAKTNDAATRAALLEKARRLGLTIDPFNKVTLLLQTRCLAALVDNPRARIWIPRRRGRRGPARPYIHTKLAITDDTALFLGSANINGRSLDGYADSEVNVLIKSTAEVVRIKGRYKWQNEPVDERDPTYLRWSDADPNPTYYARYNLGRYTKRHWEVDEAYSTFPRGKSATLDYWEAFNKSKSRRVDTWTPSLTREELGRHLDDFGAKTGVDIEDLDWGNFLIENTSHLL
ncbi:MAG TPA: hypothetical protein VK988_01195 [Acidimicrobiales bacterium]|nr:hypothetical protein [Acidimicrobiales bacterium]